MEPEGLSWSGHLKLQRCRSLPYLGAILTIPSHFPSSRLFLTYLYVLLY